MKYEQWLKDWLENYIKPTAKTKTYSRYRGIIKNQIISHLGSLEIEDLSPIDVQAFVVNLMKNGNVRNGKGLSTSTINTIITLIQSSLRTAYSLGITTEYKADKIKRPKQQEKKVECFSLKEQKQIEEYINKRHNTKLNGVILCLYTGLRLGELLALEWSDINLKNGEMNINKSCYDGKDENGVFRRITDTPKTKTSIRVIPIPKQILPMLKEMKKKSKTELVIFGRGKNFRVRSYQRSFYCMLKNIGLQKRGFHSLRHTFATRALECGMDVKTLAEILGHKNPTVTLNRYAHSLMEHKKEMMNKLGKLL
ncbi:MAG: site-specific integrase [Clostridia bacterium]|nr:site-specific integrase [Clostridia bacterium]